MDFPEILKNIFDVLSLAIILFFIYRFAVKRRAIKLAIGVVLFLLVMLVVDATELTAMGFVFGNFRQLGVIAILIIFQPELRSALEKIGGTTFEGMQNINHANDRNSDSASSHGVIEAVARAAQDLADIKYGALMVIERENSLDEYKESGTELDAVVTSNMLSSIFYKGGALHDGAVIIRDGRIDSAGCVLPMTSRVDIPKDLGTRHRASIGTTEITDAVVVIVSEETGIISISINGELERGFTYTTLRTRLEEILNPIKDSNSKKKKKRRKKNKGGANTVAKADVNANKGENADNAK